MTPTQRRCIMLAGLILLSCHGCFWRNPEVRSQTVVRPTQVVLTVSAASMLNPDVDGRPSPVMVKMYELRSVAGFDVAEYFALSTNDSVLGQDVIAAETFMLAPGAVRVWKRLLKPETRFIGVAAAFRDLEAATWRSRIPVLQGRTTQVNILLKKVSVTVMNQPDVAGNTRE